MRSQRALRYRDTMKKSTRKLVVRSETLCTLRAMSDASLSLVRGGFESTQSGANCPLQAVVVNTVSCG